MLEMSIDIFNVEITLEDMTFLLRMRNAGMYSQEPAYRWLHIISEADDSAIKKPLPHPGNMHTTKVQSLHALQSESIQHLCRIFPRLNIFTQHDGHTHVKDYTEIVEEARVYTRQMAIILTILGGAGAMIYNVTSITTTSEHRNCSIEDILLNKFRERFPDSGAELTAFLDAGNPLDNRGFYATTALLRACGIELNETLLVSIWYESLLKNMMAQYLFLCRPSPDMPFIDYYSVNSIFALSSRSDAESEANLFALMHSAIYNTMQRVMHASQPSNECIIQIDTQ